MTNDFATLSASDQQARFDTLARDALTHFGLADAAFTLMHYTNNAVYRVDAGDSRYVLRLHRPGLKRREWIESELAWLSAIQTQTRLRVPRPSAPLYVGQMLGVVSEVYGVLFGWQYGDPITKFTPLHAYKVGQFAAQLHAFSRTFTPPLGFERPRLDWEGLFGERSPYKPSPEGEALITQQHREVIAAAAAVVAETMTHLGENATSFGLIHADLLANNLLIDADTDELIALDFDDCAYGYYLYDLTPLLWGLRHEPQAADVRSTLWEAYTTGQPISMNTSQDLDTLLAARHIASIRWIAGNLSNPMIRGRAGEIIQQRVGELANFLTYRRL
jgi:Ser/Thr protein kinase RdoA (MazF antagonist)